MNCKCKSWEHRQLTIKCLKCEGYLSYVRTKIINEDDDKQKKINELKNELITKQADCYLLRLEIKELENN